MIVWGAPGAGKTSIALSLGIADRFHGDGPLARMVLESRGAGVALVVFDVMVPAQVQAARCQVAARAVFLRGWHDERPVFVPACARYGDFVAEPGNRIEWYDGPTLAALLGLEEKAAA
jgi:hypothetical protein